MKDFMLLGETLLEAEIITFAKVHKARLTQAEAQEVRRAATDLMIERAEQEPAFDAQLLLDKLSPTVWMYAENLVLDQFSKALQKDMKKRGVSPLEYTFFWLTWSWLQGKCDGRLETKEEYVARQTSSGTVYTYSKSKKGVTKTHPTEPADFDSVLSAIGSGYTLKTEGKTIYQKVAEGIEIVFRKAPGGNAPDKLAEEILFMLRKAA